MPQSPRSSCPRPPRPHRRLAGRERQQVDRPKVIGSDIDLLELQPLAGAEQQVRVALSTWHEPEVTGDVHHRIPKLQRIDQRIVIEALIEAYHARQDTVRILGVVAPDDAF